MGYLKQADPPTVVSVVTTALGIAKFQGATHRKARVWVMDSQEAILVTPGEGRLVNRATIPITASAFDRKTKMLTLTTDSGGTLTVDTRGCGCGMGAVGNAGPIDGRYQVQRVRKPEWHSE